MFFIFGLILGLLIAGAFSLLIMYLNKKKYQNDFITRLPSFQTFLSRCHSVSQRENYYIAIIDLDNFRRFNAISYRKGDVVLRYFSNQLTEQLPKNVFIARYRLGDEFILLIKGDIFNSVQNQLLQINQTLTLTENHSDSISFCYGYAKLLKGNIEVSIEDAERELIRNKKVE